MITTWASWSSAKRPAGNGRPGRPEAGLGRGLLVHPTSRRQGARLGPPGEQDLRPVDRRMPERDRDQRPRGPFVPKARATGHEARRHADPVAEQARTSRPPAAELVGDHRFGLEDEVGDEVGEDEPGQDERGLAGSRPSPSPRRERRASARREPPRSDGSRPRLGRRHRDRRAADPEPVRDVGLAQPVDEQRATDHALPDLRSSSSSASTGARSSSSGVDACRRQFARAAGRAGAWPRPSSPGRRGTRARCAAWPARCPARPRRATTTQRIGRASSRRAARRTASNGSAVGAEQALELVALGEPERREAVGAVRRRRAPGERRSQVAERGRVRRASRRRPRRSRSPLCASTPEANRPRVSRQWLIECQSSRSGSIRLIRHVADQPTDEPATRAATSSIRRRWSSRLEVEQRVRLQALLDRPRSAQVDAG